MSDGLKALKEIGAQTIHNETHITKEYVQAIIHETFDGLNVVQFTGFISILEREYELDLSELKAKGIEFFNDMSSKEEPKKVFIVTETKKSYALEYFIVTLLIFSSFIYYVFFYLDSNSSEIKKIDNTKIENAKKITQTLEIKNIVDVNSSEKTTDETKVKNDESVADNNASKLKKEELSKVIVKEIPKKESAKVERSLKVLTNRRLWTGYINIKTNQRYQQIFKKEYSFDTSKDWLLLFGAGHVELEINGEIKKFSSKQNLRFKYVDGELSKITINEFKSLNKGRKW